MKSFIEFTEKWKGLISFGALAFSVLTLIYVCVR